MHPVSRILAGLVLIAAVALPLAVQAAGPNGQVRVDQVGYTVEQPKIAWLLAARARDGQVFHVVDRDGVVAYAGAAGASRGRWNRDHRAVQPLDFSDLQRSGEYRIFIPG